MEQKYQIQTWPIVSHRLLNKYWINIQHHSKVSKHSLSFRESFFGNCAIKPIHVPWRQQEPVRPLKPRYWVIARDILPSNFLKGSFATALHKSVHSDPKKTGEKVQFDLNLILCSRKSINKQWGCQILFLGLKCHLLSAYISSILASFGWVLQLKSTTL